MEVIANTVYFGHARLRHLDVLRDPGGVVPRQKGKRMTIPHWLIVRLKNQYPMLHYLTERTFGVEIEFYGLEYVLTPVDGGIIKPYNIHSKAIDGRSFFQLCQQSKINLGTDRNSWHFEEDSSVRGLRGGLILWPVGTYDGILVAGRFKLHPADSREVDFRPCVRIQAAD